MKSWANFVYYSTVQFHSLTVQYSFILFQTWRRKRRRLVPFPFVSFLARQPNLLARQQNLLARQTNLLARQPNLLARQPLHSSQATIYSSQEIIHSSRHQYVFCLQYSFFVWLCPRPFMFKWAVSADFPPLINDIVSGDFRHRGIRLK